jgi:AcrR family transcriptional regulator
MLTVTSSKTGPEVRMDDVAAKAGAAKGMIYLHFKDKDDRYRALYLETLKKMSQRVRDALHGIEDPAAKLLRFNCEAVRYFEHNAFTLDLINRVKRLHADAKFGEEAFLECWNDFSTLLQSILIEFPAAAHMDSDHLSLAVLAFMGTTEEALHQLPRPWPANLVEHLTRLFREGFLGSRQSGRSSA